MLSRSTILGTVGYLGGLAAVMEPFCWAWGAMREFNTQHLCGEGEFIHYTRARFSLHAGARNFLVDEMRGDWLLMLDTDHTFEPDLVLKMVHLMQKYQVPILSGIYRHKALPHHPMLWMWHADHGEENFAPIIEYDTTQTLIRVDAVGAGCLLVHKSVFTRLRTHCPHEDPFDHRGRYGEDMSFFLRCREADIPVFATPLVQTDHLMLQTVTADDYRPGWYLHVPDRLETVGI